MAFGALEYFKVGKPVYKAGEKIDATVSARVDLKAEKAAVPIYWGPYYLAVVKNHITDIPITRDEILANKVDKYTARVVKRLLIDPSAFLGKHVKIGGWLKEYYDGKWWDVGCNYPCKTATIYVATGRVNVTVTPSKSKAPAGETIDLAIKLSGKVPSMGHWGVKVLLDDGTVLLDWKILISTNLLTLEKTFHVPVTLPKKIGEHKLYVVAGWQDYYSGGAMTDYMLYNYGEITGYGVADIIITEAPPQLDPNVFKSTIKAFWNTTRTADKITLGPGDKTVFWTVVNTAGSGHYYLIVDTPGKRDTVDLGTHAPGDSFSVDHEITAPDQEGDYTVEIQLAVLDPADGKLKTIPNAKASLPFTVRGGTLDEAKNSTLSVDVPALTLPGKRVNITARVVAAASGYYMVTIHQGDTPIGSVGGPIWIDKGKSTAFVGWVKFDKEGTYDLTFRLEFGTDGQHFYDTGVAKSATIQVVPPVGLVKDWSVSADKQRVEPGDEVTVTVTVNWQVMSGVQFAVRFDWFGVSLESQPVAPSTSPAVIKATLTVPKEPTKKEASATLLVGV